MFQVEAEQTVLWAPQPGPQTALLECPIFEVFYGGARGGGKTESSIGDWLQHSSLYGEAAIGIFFRRKLVQLAEVVARTKQIFPKLGAKYNEQQKTWTMANGARLGPAQLDGFRNAGNHFVAGRQLHGNGASRLPNLLHVGEKQIEPVPLLQQACQTGSKEPCGCSAERGPSGAAWWRAPRHSPGAPGSPCRTEELPVGFS